MANHRDRAPSRGKNPPIQWHPAFVSALHLELGESDPQAALRFEPEHLLNSAPLQVDLLITDEDDAPLRNEIGLIFRRYNLLEYKSPGGGLSVDTFYKAVAYAALFKAGGRTEDAIPAEQVTVSFLRRAKPVKLFRYLQKHGMEAKNPASGIYHIVGCLFPMQIVVLRELDPALHSWLPHLSDDLSEDELASVIRSGLALEGQSRHQNQEIQALVKSVLDVIIKANEALTRRLLQEDSAMPDFIRDYFHVDELEATISSQQEQLATQQEQLADRELVISSQQERLATQQEQLADREFVISSQQEQLAQQSARISALEAQLAARG